MDSAMEAMLGRLSRRLRLRDCPAADFLAVPPFTAVPA